MKTVKLDNAKMAHICHHLERVVAICSFSFNNVCDIRMMNTWKLIEDIRDTVFIFIYKGGSRAWS